MTRQFVYRENQSPKKEADKSILKRRAVRSLPAKKKTPQVQTESRADDKSRIKLDLMQIPLSNDTPSFERGGPSRTAFRRQPQAVTGSPAPSPIQIEEEDEIDDEILTPKAIRLEFEPEKLDEIDTGTGTPPFERGGPLRTAFRRPPDRKKQSSPNAFVKRSGRVLTSDTAESLYDMVASGSGITGDYADVDLTVTVPENYNPSDAYTDLSEQGGAKLNNPVFDIGEGANIGLGALNIRGAFKELRDPKRSKARVVAQGLEGTGQIAHGAGKSIKGLASIKDGSANPNWTQVGDAGAAIGDGLSTVSSIILTFNDRIKAWKKHKQQGSLTGWEKIDEGLTSLVTVADVAQSGLNTGKDIVKAATQVGANNPVIQQGISNMTQGAAIIGIIVGSIQVIHGGITTARGFYNKGQIQKIKEPIRAAVIQVHQNIPQIQQLCEQQFYDPSVTFEDLLKTYNELKKLKIAFEELSGFYEQYAPAMDAMSKIENQRMAEGGMKMAGGGIGIASGALLVSGVGAPIAIAVSAIGGILALGNIFVNWRRNKASERLTKIARKLDDDGRPNNEFIKTNLTYQEMERRMYKCYYSNLPEVMQKQKTIPNLEKDEFTDVKRFVWDDKKSRLSKNDRYTVTSLDKVRGLDDLTKKEHWLQVKPTEDGKVTYKEKPKEIEKFKRRFTASAHKSEAAMDASAEVVAKALYSLGISSYDTTTESFVSCKINPIDIDRVIDPNQREQTMKQIKNQTSITLLKVADIDAKRWKAWLETTQGDPSHMNDLIKEQVSGKKATKVKGRGGRRIRDYLN